MSGPERAPTPGSHHPHPHRVVAFGGGTGLPALLRGLRDRIGDGATAVVAVADDGGSSGRLRAELGVAPPGDIRRCLVALANRRRLAELFDYRFAEGGDLGDHSVGNIMIAALADLEGSFEAGIERAGRILRVQGRVLPAAVQSHTLVVTYADGTVTRGESTMRDPERHVHTIAVEPQDAPAPGHVIEAIERAHLVVLAAGSLFSSTIPSMLGAGVREALAAFNGPVAYVANVMTQPGETGGFSLSDHVRALHEHIGPIITDVIVAADELPGAMLQRYAAEGALPVQRDVDATRALGVRLHEARLLTRAPEVRHDGDALASAVLAVGA